MLDGRQPQGDGALRAQTPLLEAKSLSFEANGAHLLKGVDLRLDAAGATVVMGPNGAGKSLLLRLLHGLLPPSDGEVLWRGAPLDPSARQSQAMVFQRAVLLRRSAAANIDFALKLRGGGDADKTAAKRDALLAQTGLLEKAHQPARRLSGGEQQRLSLARALATSPEALFLDEPTASLDPASTLHIERVIEQVKDQGVKIVFVTHDRDQARRIADDIVFVHRGEIAEHASAARFFTHASTTAARAYLAGELAMS